MYGRANQIERLWNPEPNIPAITASTLVAAGGIIGSAARRTKILTEIPPAQSGKRIASVANMAQLLYLCAEKAKHYETDIYSWTTQTARGWGKVLLLFLAHCDFSSSGWATGRYQIHVPALTLQRGQRTIQEQWCHHQFWMATKEQVLW